MPENYDYSLLTVNNLEKYHAGYKDRNLIWCKTYFTMINADPEFEMMHETDKWRLIAFVMLELQIKKPVPLNEEYLKRKGFDLEARPISLTIQMLHSFIAVDTQKKSCRVIEKRREYKEENIKKSRKKKKKKVKEEKELVFPECVDRALIEKYFQNRIDIKKAMTHNAKELLLLKVQKFHDEGIEVETCLEEAIIGNWSNIFRPKGDGNGKNNRGRKQEPVKKAGSKSEGEGKRPTVITIGD